MIDTYGLSFKYIWKLCRQNLFQSKSFYTVKKLVGLERLLKRFEELESVSCQRLTSNGDLKAKTLTLVEETSSSLLMPPPIHMLIQLDTLQLYHGITFKLLVLILPDRVTSLPCKEGPYIMSWSDQEFPSEIYDRDCSMAHRLGLN